MDTDSQSMLNYLFGLERKGIKLGLEPTKELLERCGNPHVSFPIAQIAGTNGKGSTAAITGHILQLHGKKVGLFTSPHLCRFNERIRVNGKPIENSFIVQWIKQYKEHLESIPVTFFEANTALALCYFQHRRVDIAILETGLGGRLDATTATNPAWSALTPIDLDHMDLLGDTVESIAREKAGILKPGIPCFSTPQPENIKMVIEDEAEHIGAPITFIDTRTNVPIPLKMLGDHQHTNAALAWALAGEILNGDFDPGTAREAVEKAYWPGRYQWLGVQPKVVYDVAHNPHGIRAVLTTISKEHHSGSKWLVLALQQGKKVNAILDILLPEFDAVVFTQSGIRDYIPAHEIPQHTESLHSRMRIVPNAHQAVRETVAKAEKHDFVAILGTHYLGPVIAEVFKISFDNLLLNDSISGQEF
jgi:dihydrofolate synthase/folylpolyglutamate synthase